MFWAKRLQQVPSFRDGSADYCTLSQRDTLDRLVDNPAMLDVYGARGNVVL
jgi:hypothetical protein